jgi:hypothetical protein
MRSRRAFVGALAALATLPAPMASAQGDSSELRNWFDDPYFQASAFVRDCPEPRGPRISKGEMQREAHVRSERGTRCWLEGKCTRSNSYQYDRDIAAELARRLEGAQALAGTTVWVTVQRRWVWLQGCAPTDAKKRALGDIARKVPDVERVFVELGTAARPGYPTLRTQAR